MSTTPRYSTGVKGMRPATGLCGCCWWAQTVPAARGRGRPARDWRAGGQVRHPRRVGCGPDCGADMRYVPATVARPPNNSAATGPLLGTKHCCWPTGSSRPSAQPAKQPTGRLDTCRPRPRPATTIGLQQTIWSLPQTATTAGRHVHPPGRTWQVPPRPARDVSPPANPRVATIECQPSPLSSPRQPPGTAAGTAAPGQQRLPCSVGRKHDLTGGPAAARRPGPCRDDLAASQRTTRAMPKTRGRWHRSGAGAARCR
jgi:hypothetical protein